MPAFLGFFLTKYGIAALALVFSLAGFQIWKINYGMTKKQEGKTELIQESKVEAKKLNEKVKKATKHITPATAATELLKQYSRD